MTTPATSTGFLEIHVKRLREQLNEWRVELDPDLASPFIDIWFVDTDVLSVYINGSANSFISGWPSLYALGPPEHSPKRDTAVSESDKELIDSVASAVSYFLFGRFRETLTVQGRRFLLTPEHNRELDALTIAVSFGTRGETTGYMSALQAHYMGLARAHGDDAPSEAIKNIFSLLRKGSPANKVSRTLDLRRGLVESMQDTAFFPSSESGNAFAFLADRELRAARIEELAEEAFECFMKSLLNAHPDVELVAHIKESVFRLHAPERRFRRYVDHIMRMSHRSMDGGERSHLDESALRKQAQIAARQVADVYSLARLVALVESLNESHPQGTRSWRANLLTDSRMQRALIDEWRQRDSTAAQVRLVHPLSTMVMDGFVKPEEGRWGRVENVLKGASSGAYALRVLEQKHSEDVDVQVFLDDLSDLLSSAAVSSAPYRERGMRSLRMKLNGLESLERTSYMRALRDAISRDFVLTFAQLNQIPHQRRGKLPAVSLPTLQLPSEGEDPSSAQTYVMRLHDQWEDATERGRGSPLRQPYAELSSHIRRILEFDSTGFNALLCSGLGYLAQGRDWLPLAEAVASTAVAFTSTNVARDCEEGAYPMGHEAFYLAAFVSRMKVDGAAPVRERAATWQTRHNSLMQEAFSLLDSWQDTELGARRIANEASEKTESASLSELVRLRYDAEQVGGMVFCQMIDRIDVEEPKLATQSPLDTLEEAKRLAKQWSAIARLELVPQYRVDVSFVGAQLCASIMQAWLCLLADRGAETMLVADAELRRHEAWIRRLVASPAVGNLRGSSMLVRVLTAIFLARTGHTKLNTKDSTIAERDLQQMEFATLDQLRGPLFMRLLSDPTIPAAKLFHRNS